MKANELTGAALDWAVAKCEGLMMGKIAIDGITQGFYKPSINWAQGGPIIEREQLEVMPTTECGNGGEEQWEVRKFLSECELFAQYGPTPLIAAMRCYVASKLGDTVEVPTELG